jgi:hypothetical protein
VLSTNFMIKKHYKDFELDIKYIAENNLTNVLFKEYGIVKARSSSRFWCIPLENKYQILNAFNMLHPTSFLAVAAIRIYTLLFLYNFKFMNRYIVKKLPDLTIFFDRLVGNIGSIAIFSGSESPHRKTVFQLQTRNGRVKAYAKVSRNPYVSDIIINEHTTLRFLEENITDIQGLAVPKVLFYDATDEFTVLITSNETELSKKIESKISKEHIDTINALMELKSHQNLHSEYFNLERCLDLLKKNNKFWESAWNQYSNIKFNSLPTRFSHGDFTITNSVLELDAVYVFDWEYASFERPMGYDLLTLYLSINTTNSFKDRADKLLQLFKSVFIDASNKEILDLVITNLFANAFFYLNRDAEAKSKYSTWSNEPIVKGIINELLAEENIITQ